MHFFVILIMRRCHGCVWPLWGGARVNTGEKITQTETSPSEAEASHIGGRQTSGDRGLFLSSLPVDSYVTQHGQSFGAEVNNEYRPKVLLINLQYILFQLKERDILF